ncbi:unnamed protein product [Prorocentrum cordatum]|uniref:RRM domain-containing protein n=1 Tax=Prorocentrum cordatum TaxID=2364126 RepID=A0ABN9TWQ4_9DINO|nr:unnamed protein product [Polarella glacialis]
MCQRRSQPIQRGRRRTVPWSAPSRLRAAVLTMSVTGQSPPIGLTMTSGVRTGPPIRGTCPSIRGMCPSQPRGPARLPTSPSVSGSACVIRIGAWSLRTCRFEEASRQAVGSWAPPPRSAEMLDSEHAEENATTVMLRNLPPSYTRQMLIDMIAAKGFLRHCDFLYLPINFKRNLNVGYAFLNFTSREQTELFFAAFEGFSGWDVPSGQVCSVCWSETKGLKANIERYRNSPIMRAEVPDGFKPTLLVDGRPIPFPSPTTDLRSLRFRKGHGIKENVLESDFTLQ